MLMIKVYKNIYGRSIYECKIFMDFQRVYIIVCIFFIYFYLF